MQEKVVLSVIIDNDFTYFDDFVEMHIEMVKKFGMVSKKGRLSHIYLNIFRKKLNFSYV